MQKPLAKWEPAAAAAGSTARPTVTVMVITYNHAKYIGRCLDSILAQKLDCPLAIHVIDDCSTDGAQDIIRDYAVRYPGVVKPFINKKNIGRKVTQKNFYRGFCTLDGDYCAIIEGDDYWNSPHRLRTHVEFLEANPGYVGASNHTLKIYQDHSKEPHLFLAAREKQDHTLADFILLDSFFHASSLTFRNVFRGRVPRYLRSSKSCDIFITIAHAQHGKVRFFPEPWSIYRAHSGGMFSQMNELKGWIWNIDGMRACNRWLGFRHFPLFAESIRRYCEFVVKSATPELGATPATIRKYEAMGRRYAWMLKTYRRTEVALRALASRVHPRRVHKGEPVPLNLGCGFATLPNVLNVDRRPEVNPTQVWDLDRTPWPWPADFTHDVQLFHALEYLGADFDTFQAVMRELYRVSRHGANIAIKTTFPRHQQFLDDPEIVRAITPDLMRRFDVLARQRWGVMPLHKENGVDFEVVRAETFIAEPYRGRLERGEITKEEVAALIKTAFGVGLEYRMELRVHKPPRVKEAAKADPSAEAEEAAPDVPHKPAFIPH